MDNKNIFAENLNYYMDLHQKSRREVSEALDVSYYTFTDWVKGKKYPRMDKVEMLANYFGILKSDLIEEKKPSSLKDVKLSEGEQALIELFRRIPEDKQQLALQMIRVVLENQ